MVQFILDHNKGTPQNELARLFNERFGTDRTGDNMKSFRSNHKLDSGLTGQFRKGQQSWNKGKKWDDFMSKEAQANSRKTCFKKGQLPGNTYPVGAERITKDGYVQVKVTDEFNGKNGLSRKNWVLKQRLVWEEHHGPIPKDHIIIFLDGNIQNFDIDNLACISMAENARLNQRKYRIDGEPELTQAGISIVRIDEKIRERNKKNQRENQQKKQKK